MTAQETRLLQPLLDRDAQLSEMLETSSLISIANDVAVLVQMCVTQGQLITDPVQRRQVRGILQYWATQQYKHLGVYDLQRLSPLSESGGESNPTGGKEIEKALADAKPKGAKSRGKERNPPKRAISAKIESAELSGEEVEALARRIAAQKARQSPTKMHSPLTRLSVDVHPKKVASYFSRALNTSGHSMYAADGLKQGQSATKPRRGTKGK